AALVPPASAVSASGWSLCAHTRMDLTGSSDGCADGSADAASGGLPPDPLADVWEELAALSTEWESAQGLDQASAIDAGPGWNRPDSDPAVVADADGAWLPEGMLDVTGPGPLLAGLLNQVDLGAVCDERVIEVAAAAARMGSWAAALEIEATAQLLERVGSWRGVIPHGRPGRDRRVRGAAPAAVSAELMAAAELGAALTLSPRAAAGRVGLATELARLPGTRAALAAGRIDLSRARSAVEILAPLDDEGARLVEARVLARAADKTNPALRAALRRAALAVDPQAAQRRHEQRLIERDVSVWGLPDGMATLGYTDSAEKVEALYRWVAAKAQAAKGPAGSGDTRTGAQRRADVLADLGAERLGFDRLPTCQGRRPQVQVVVSAATLLGLDEAPGELVGVGPITAQVARRIAADATWRRLLTDPRTGRFDELSVDTYEPPQDLRDHVTARDRTCRGLGCRVLAQHCDLDHRVPHPRGPTAAHNLDPDCRPHHEIKTFTDTTVEPDGAGGLWITLPSGRRYHRPAEPVLDTFDGDTPDGDTPAGGTPVADQTAPAGDHDDEIPPF
ncbi:MAG: hypothetical protein QOJ60_513, partial [Actinomycetota bacterium]|nr:hypothetical protein [Actinomycetota bacterium]